MKFQDSSFNGLKVTVGTKSVTHARTHAPKQYAASTFSKLGEKNKNMSKLFLQVEFLFMN